ncbi:MAG TPA: response regulator transcription factor [Gemmatimonadaceae bacterium]|jgi:two-component system, NarL family, invasion response regulator UvrY|nr:response regulator transcription factor [Gemmatimonadaceae bacterium]
MIRVAIADDHPIVREGLRRIVSENPGISVVGEASSAVELFRLLAAAPVDVVLLDVSMPGATYIDTLKDLRREHPSVKLLVISAHPEDQWAARSLRAGASGYLTKDRSPEQLVLAIGRVARGGKYVSESMAERLAGMIDSGQSRAVHETLSDREFEVLRALGSGMMVKDVAAQLGLSAKTVSTYRTRLLEKMGLKTKQDLVRYVVAHDLLK